MRNLAQYFEGQPDVYYSGTSVEVYIGNTLVNEATMIGWNHVSTQSPVFAYNKDRFASVLHGKYHVEGKLAIKSTTTGYLEYILLYSGELTFTSIYPRSYKLIILITRP